MATLPVERTTFEYLSGDFVYNAGPCIFYKDHLDQMDHIVIHRLLDTIPVHPWSTNQEAVHQRTRAWLAGLRFAQHPDTPPRDRVTFSGTLEASR